MVIKNQRKGAVAFQRRTVLATLLASALPMGSCTERGPTVDYPHIGFLEEVKAVYKFRSSGSPEYAYIGTIDREALETAVAAHGLRVERGPGEAAPAAWEISHYAIEDDYVNYVPEGDRLFVRGVLPEVGRVFVSIDELSGRAYIRLLTAKILVQESSVQRD